MERKSIRINKEKVGKVESKNKKGVRKQQKKQNINKSHPDSIFTKTNNFSTAICNNSVLTQRNNSCSKSKVCSVNPEIQNTVRAKSNCKKVVKTATTTKTDRKLQYTKQKAKQLHNFALKKQCSLQKNQKKRAKSAYTSFSNKVFQDQKFNKVQVNPNFTKIQSFLKQGTQRITEIKKNSDSFVLSEMEKAQKLMIQKLTLLQKNNAKESFKSQQRFSELHLKYENQVNSYKEQAKHLKIKAQEQMNKNVILEKRIESYQRDFQNLNMTIAQKDKTIKSLQQKKLLNDHQNDHKSFAALDSERNRIADLQLNVEHLKRINHQFEEDLKKCQEQKKYIRESSAQVLSILRQQFGEELKGLIKNK